MKNNQANSKQWSAALYLRLSRDDDKHESDSIISQRKYLLNFVERNPDITVYDIYIDDGWSGTNFERPSFKKMEEALLAKQINCIIVKDLSRFARNCNEIGKYLTLLFPYLRTRFICVNDNIDSYLDPESLDNLSTKVKNLINDEYCRDISNKVKSALTAKRYNGDFIGSFACYGYSKDEQDHHKLIVDREAADVVIRIKDMFLAGHSMRSIVRILNSEKIPCPSVYKKKKYVTYNPSQNKEDTAWTTRTVKRILTNKMYLGHMVQGVMKNVNYKIQKCQATDENNYIVVENTHEPLFTTEEYYDIQDLLLRDTRESPITNNLNILSGFIKCGDCGRGMNHKSIISGNKEYFYYICSTFKNRGKQLCSKHTIRVDKIENAVLLFIQYYIKIAFDIDAALNSIDNSAKQNMQLEKYNSIINTSTNKIEHYNQLKNELYPDYKDGLIDKEEYELFKQKYVDDINQEQQKIIDAKTNIEKITSGIVEENAFIKAFKENSNITELSRDIIIALIDNIYVYENNEIRISMKYQDDFLSIVNYIKVNNISLPQDTVEILEQRLKV